MIFTDSDKNYSSMNQNENHQEFKSSENRNGDEIY